MSHSFTNLLRHIVFSTRHREPTIAPVFSMRLHAYPGGITKETLGGIPLAVNGTDDHVHLLIKLPPVRTVADSVRELKTRSSGWVHRTFQGHRGFRWQTGYGAFSVSASPASRVTRYIRNQERHLENTDLRDEFIGLLVRHGMTNRRCGIESGTPFFYTASCVPWHRVRCAHTGLYSGSRWGVNAGLQARPGYCPG